MKVVCTTTYSNVSQEWLDWYIRRLSSHPDLKDVAECLNATGKAEYWSKDPTSECAALTTYEVVP